MHTIFPTLSKSIKEKGTGYFFDLLFNNPNLIVFNNVKKVACPLFHPGSRPANFMGGVLFYL
jgi:hypothetical protein